MVHHGPISPFTSPPAAADPCGGCPSPSSWPRLGAAAQGVERRGPPRSPRGAAGLGVGNGLEIQWEGHSWDPKKNVLPSKAGELISLSSRESR